MTYIGWMGRGGGGGGGAKVSSRAPSSEFQNGSLQNRAAVLLWGKRTACASLSITRKSRFVYTRDQSEMLNRKP